MPKKVKIKPGKGTKDVGEAILDLWRASSGTQTIDPKAAAQALGSLLDLAGPTTPGGNKKKDIIFDVIIDQDIDSNTRMIWIAIPVPDVDINPGTGVPVQTWEDYANSITTDEEKEKLGEAVLFGCGR